MNFQLPPRIFNAEGEKRRVGFELEFGGLELEDAAKIIVQLFGGSAQRKSEFVYIAQTGLGDFTLEADSTFLKDKKYERYLDALGLDRENSALAQNIEGMFAKLAGTLIPFEIAMPPLPIDNLKPVEMIRRELQINSAKGTKSSIFMAFGMQFNPEVPDMQASTILKTLRAFFLMFDWLYEESDIPVARKVAPFIHDFPDDYVRLVLEPSYEPDITRLITDYLIYNPTRNRPLDMLPLFAHIDSRLVFSYPVETDLVKPRPTYHYRLPNSMVDDPQWSIAGDWNKWVDIERLAADKSRLARMTKDFFATREENVLFVRSKWAEKTRQWLHA